MEDRVCTGGGMLGPRKLRAHLGAQAVKMLAEIVDGSGVRLVSATADIAQAAELAALVKRVTDQFRTEHPGKSLLTDIDHAGCYLRIVKA